MALTAAYPGRGATPPSERRWTPWRPGALTTSVSNDMSNTPETPANRLSGGRYSAIAPPSPFSSWYIVPIGPLHSAPNLEEHT